MTTYTDDRPLEFVDTHRVDADVQATILDELAADAAAAARTITTGAALCSCRSTVHAALCPANPDPSVCDVCDEAYDPDTVATSADCPGGHCADEACACWSCHRTGYRS